MSEPDGPDATRRTLIRGAVVLGAVGVGAGLSRLGEGTYDLASTESETDVAAQAPSAETPASAEPSPSAEPTKAAKPKSKSSKSAEPTASAKSKSTDSTTSAKSTSSDSAKSGKSEDSAEEEKPTKKKAEPKPAGTPLGPASKVPVGGGAIYKDKRVVVTQPSKGEYKVFDALCTHANCLVDEVAAGTINCPCHNAKFNIADGSVKKPSVARRPLPPKGTVTESGGTLYLS
jgi:nitrite reductase/ring-hydroxylating ferredoxin subunit